MIICKNCGFPFSCLIYIEWCMDLSSELFMHTWGVYFEFFFLLAMREMNTKIALKCMYKQFVMRVHTLFLIFTWHKESMNYNQNDDLHTSTHWGQVTHICVGNLTIIGSDNGLSPDRRQAIIWTNAGILLIGPLGTNFSEILIEIHTFSFKKMHFKMSSRKWRPFCLGLNVLTQCLTCWVYNLLMTS